MQLNVNVYSLNWREIFKNKISKYYSWRSLTSCVCATCGVYCADLKPRWKNQCRNIPYIFLGKRTTSIIFWVVLFTIVSEKSCNLIPCIRAHTYIYLVQPTRFWTVHGKFCGTKNRSIAVCSTKCIIHVIGHIWNRLLHSRGISLFASDCFIFQFGYNIKSKVTNSFLKIYKVVKFRISRWFGM